MKKEIEVHKHELMSRISHLNTLLEVVPIKHPKFNEYSEELNTVIKELRELNYQGIIKEEKRLSNLN